jgi:hypothetical protein
MTTVGGGRRCNLPSPSFRQILSIFWPGMPWIKNKDNQKTEEKGEAKTQGTMAMMRLVMYVKSRSNQPAQNISFENEVVN